MIADGVTFGMAEALGKSKRTARPWARGATLGKTDLVSGLARLAQRPGAARLAPMPFASTDGPLTSGGMDVGAEIARLRAEAIAASRVH